jgi:hypothetical protein
MIPLLALLLFTLLQLAWNPVLLSDGNQPVYSIEASNGTVLAVTSVTSATIPAPEQVVYIWAVTWDGTMPGGCSNRLLVGPKPSVSLVEPLAGAPGTILIVAEAADGQYTVETAAKLCGPWMPGEIVRSTNGIVTGTFGETGAAGFARLALSGT